MACSPPRRRLLLAAGFALLAGCDAPPDDAAVRDTEDRLAGTWMREYDEAGTHVRRVLVLAAGGAFQEEASVEMPGQPPVRVASSGTWLYDGTNLKRKYAVMDGKPTSSPMVPFATFQLAFDGRHEFVGVDHVHRREIRYRRVPDGTHP